MKVEVLEVPGGLDSSKAFALLNLLDAACGVGVFLDVLVCQFVIGRELSFSTPTTKKSNFLLLHRAMDVHHFQALVAPHFFGFRNKIWLDNFVLSTRERGLRFPLNQLAPL